MEELANRYFALRGRRSDLESTGSFASEKGMRNS